MGEKKKKRESQYHESNKNGEEILDESHMKSRLLGKTCEQVRQVRASGEDWVLVKGSF